MSFPVFLLPLVIATIPGMLTAIYAEGDPDRRLRRPTLTAGRTNQVGDGELHNVGFLWKYNLTVLFVN